MPACGRSLLRWSGPRRAAMYRDKASIATRVSHPANEVSGRFALQRHCVGHRAQRRQVDAFAWRLNRRDLRHKFAASCDSYGDAGGRSLDQFTKMRLCVGEIDAVHTGLMTTWLVTSSTVLAAGQPSGFGLSIANQLVRFT